MAMPLPLYRTLAGDADLPLRPPFRSLGMLNRYFPLAADLNSLRRFCDAYINFTSKDGKVGIPEGAGRFVPVMPYVLLMETTHPHLVVNHDRFGWFSQRELAFAFPVEWYRYRNGQWELEGYAYVIPFIYLDSSLGLTTGREVHGWPKQPATFHGSLDEDASQLKSPGMLRVKAQVSKGAMGGGEFAPAVLVEIGQRPGTGEWSIANGFSAQSAAFTWWASVAQAYDGLTASPWEGANPWLYLQRWRYLMPSSDYGIITLKQFRDVAQPELAGYQALVHSTMRAERVTGMGLIGSAAQCMGDLSGGYTVRINDFYTDAIVDQLGLQRADVQVKGGSVLMPVAPFWIQFDAAYGPGQVLCTRTKSSSWRTGREAPAEPSAGGGRENPYTLTQSFATEVQPWPLVSHSTVRVLPLPADPGVLRLMCERYLGATGAASLEPVGEWVYLVVTEGTHAQEDVTGAEWRAREAVFFVPLLRDGELVWFSPYMFVDNGMSALTERELWGQNVMLGDLTGEWAGTRTSGLLELRTAVFPVLHQDASSQQGLLLAISPADAGLEAPRVTLPAQVAEQSRSLLDGDQGALRLIALKQYRDAEEPRQAACQSLVRWTVKVERDSPPNAQEAPSRGELEAAVQVSLSDYDLPPVARVLGLRPQGIAQGPGGAGRVLVFPAVRPYRVNVKRTAHQGEELWTATGAQARDSR